MKITSTSESFTTNARHSLISRVLMPDREIPSAQWRQNTAVRWPRPDAARARSRQSGAARS
jgi:hypothetical protein